MLRSPPEAAAPAAGQRTYTGGPGASAPVRHSRRFAPRTPRTKSVNHPPPPVPRIRCGSTAVTPSRELFEPARFAYGIARIAERRLSSPSFTRLQEGGVSITTIDRSRDRVARLLVDDLLAGRIAERPGRMYVVTQDRKARRLFEFSLVEMIIQDAVAHWLAEQSSGALSARLYSYRSGTSYHRALRDFAQFIRHVRKSGCRGLYVLRRDVRSYFDSIPVHDDAPLWTSLEPFVAGSPRVEATRMLLRRALRPQLVSARGEVYRLESGIPTGSPVANVVANLYLRTMDAELGQVAGAFYARYGDDIIAAHPDATTIETLGRSLAAYLSRHDVESNPEKVRDCYLTTAGRPEPTGRPFRGGSAVEFLGHRIMAIGTVGLSRRKTRALLNALRAAAANAARAGIPSIDARIHRIVQSVNALLSPMSAAAHPYAILLRTTVTDRPYLEWLDHEVALIVLEAAFGRRSVIHFRRVPPRTLRTSFRLRSLLASRNGDRR